MTKRIPSMLAGWFLLIPLAAVTQAENRLDIRTIAKHGGMAITEITAQGDMDLHVQNQATRRGTSTMLIDAASQGGGQIRGRIYGGSRGGTQHSELFLRASGPGAAIDVQDTSLANRGEIDNRKRLVVEGDSRLRWRSQQLAESGGFASTRHEVYVQADPASRNRAEVEMVTDATGHAAVSRFGLQATSRDGGLGQHRATGISIGHNGQATIHLDLDHRAWGGVNRSDITSLDIR